MKIIQEHVSLSARQPFLVSLFENKEVDLSYPFHHHQKAYELTLTLGVSGTRMVGDSTEQFTGADLVLMAPGLAHCWQDHGVKSGSEQKVLVIQFSDALIPENVRSFNLYQQINAALKNAQYGLEMLEVAKSKAQRLLAEFGHQSDLENYLALLKILDLFGARGATKRLCSEGYSKPVFKGESGRLNQVLEYIQAHYSRKLPIEEVAQQVHLSPSAFSHYFKKRTLKSFTHFVLELRLGKAAQLLQYTDLPVTSVSHECGFQNMSHFNRSFNKKYSTTPLQFRRQAV
ncbi:MAG: AraC family transcriptional regulator [Bacteroidota bacterium]